jgi:hypothetical protein
VNFAVSKSEYDYEPVHLFNGKFVRNQPIILGDNISESGFLGDKKNNSILIVNAELEYVPGELMNYFPNLRELGIHGSIKANIIGPDFIDQGLEKLEKLIYFNEKNINALRTDVFINLPNLKVLFLVHTTIQDLREGVFRSNKKIESVIFHQSRISIIPENLFAGMVDLKSVTISMCPIKVLPANLFLGNKSLNKLIFNTTEIKELPENLLSELFELETFEFRKSQIKIIPDNFFKNNFYLERVILDFNEIERIPDGTFDRLYFLEMVNLVNNTCINKNFGKFAIETLNAELKNCY